MVKVGDDRVKIKAKREVFLKTRVSKGLSQRELADLAGLSHSYICLIERSNKSVSPSTAKRLCDVLEKELDELFCIG